MQQRLALANRHDLVGRSEGQELVESPNTAQAERFVAPAPLLFELPQGRGNTERVPIVVDIQQGTARVAAGPYFRDVVRGSAAGHDAPLISQVGFSFHGGSHGRLSASPAGRLSSYELHADNKALLPNNLVTVYLSPPWAATQKCRLARPTNC